MTSIGLALFPFYPEAKLFNRVIFSQENGFLLQGMMALLVKIGSDARSYREDDTALFHKGVCGIGV